MTEEEMREMREMRYQALKEALDAVNDLKVREHKAIIQDNTWETRMQGLGMASEAISKLML